jgi:hypothetical protein
MIAHGIELACWIGGAASSAMSLADKKRALVWLGIAGILCNAALVASHA